MPVCTPKWGNTHVDALAGKGHEVTQIPSTGLGGSEGPGTYVRYRELGVEKQLQFDQRKMPLHLKGKGKGKQKGK